MSLRPYFAALLAVSLVAGVARADVNDASSSSTASSSSSSSSDSGSSFAAGRSDSITDKGPHDRASNLSLMAYVPWYYGIGIGLNVRYAIPIVKNGFIPSLNNSFSIEPSASLSYASWYGASVGVLSIIPACYGIWEFYFNPKFSAYAGIGLGYEIGIVTGNYYGNLGFSQFFWDPVVGMHYKFGNSIAFRAEVGSQAIKGGLSFFF